MLELFTNIKNCAGNVVPAEQYDWCSVFDIGVRIVRIAFSLAGFVALVYLIIGGIHYMTAYGNEEKATRGKQTVTWAIVGLIICMLAYFLANLVWQIFVTRQFPTNIGP